MKKIPGAPGFSAPRDMAPEEFQAWLARVRFGGSSMNDGASSLPDDEADNGMPVGADQVANPAPPVTDAQLALERQAAVNQVDPQVVRQFMDTMTHPTVKPPSLDNSYTLNQQAAMGHASPNFGPARTMAEFDAVRPPEFYDLPEDAAIRNMAMERFKVQGALDAADQRGEAAMAVAQAKQSEAAARQTAAGLQQALGDIYRQHPELVARTAQGARMAGGFPPDPDKPSALDFLNQGDANPTATPAPEKFDPTEVRVVNGVRYRKAPGGWKRF